LQTAIDGVPDPAIVVNTDYQITSMNKVAHDAFADAQTDDDPLFCYRAMRGLDAPCDDPEYPCTITSGMPCKKIQNRKGPNGDYQQVEFRTTPLRGPDGEITGAIEIAHDLNEREQINYKLRRAKERAEASNQVKSEFVAAMSHEIRTPLNAVLGMTDLLRLTNLTRKQHGYIETIQSSGNMLLSLVDNILDFSRLGAGALEIQRREFSVLELLERVLSITGYHAYSKGLELVGILDADLTLRVSGDRSRLRQVLVNLARNAVKFSDEGEVVIRIGVDSARDGKYRLSFVVTDRGIGMSDDVKARLFTPFANVRQQFEGQQGSGLGLTICKNLIEQMGGEIGIDSEPGKGTCVRFSVPVERKTSAEHEQVVDYLALQGKRVLTVHGITEIDQAVCSYAMAFGMRCDVAASDDEVMQRLALAARNGQPYTAVVIDSTLPGSRALALARRIRDADKLSRTGIALLTPISESLEPGKISSIGRIRCVNKPVLPSELLQCLLQLDGPDTSLLQDAAATDDADEDNARLRILVAEDNPVNRQVLTGMLESLGHAADCVEDGPTALEVLSESSYDIVLMDCQMPGMDGERVTEAIRNDKHRFSVQPVIIAVTADASIEHQSACRAAGMDDFIAKPIRLGELSRRLQNWKSILLAYKKDARNGDQDQNPQGDDELLSHLHQRTGADDELFLSTYIDLFLQDTAARLNKLSDAMDSGDTAAIMRECHTLKGACLEFGMSRMGRYCDDIRDSAANRNLDVIPQLLIVLQREFERIGPVLEAEKAAQLSRSRPDR
jgi:signal transduction histidine kinase/DNA-binding response OmpR family regulator